MTKKKKKDMRVLGGVGNNSGKIVLDILEHARIKSRENFKQGITVVKATSNQSVCSQRSSIMHEIPSKSLKIPDMNKAILTGIPDVK